MEIVSGRVDRLKESVKKPRPNREQEIAELAALEEVLAAMEAGQPLAESAMTEPQLKATRSFRLLTEKPALVILNVADDEADPAARAKAVGGDRPVLGVRVGLERELARMSPEERAEFEQDLGLAGHGSRRRAADDPGSLGPNALFHRRRERSSHVDDAQGGNGPGGGR